MPDLEPRQATLELGVIGNASVAALVGDRARSVWHCLPRFDADVSFCAALSSHVGGGDWAIELEDFESAAQRTRLGFSSGDIASESSEAWDGFAQTCSMIGLSGAVSPLSRSWEEAL